jgi:WD40-like Beta Propeller Repeat
MDPLTGLTSDLSVLDISPSGEFVAVDGGAPVVLVEGATNPFGLSWNTDGTILYGQADGIWRVSHNGGKPERIVKIEAPEQAYGPHLLPGGQWLLFTLTRATGANRWNAAEIVVQSLATGERRMLRAGGFDARYLPTGHIVYMFQNVLFASRFDAKTLKLDEERVALVPDVLPTAPATGGGGNYSVANNGTLVYLPTGATGTYSRPKRSVAWVDRTGKAPALPLRPDDYTMARLSPDGTRIALVVGSLMPPSDPPPDIYVFDVKTENLTQLTFNPQADDGPVWSRDGSRIYYRSFVTDGTAGEIYVLPADGGTPERVAGSDNPVPLPWSISADGATLLLVDSTTVYDVDLAVLEIGKDKSVRRLLDPNQFVNEPSLSPNGQWLAYYQVDQATSMAEVDIRPYPDVRQQRRPVGRGLHPVFSADGSEIFFFDGEDWYGVGRARRHVGQELGRRPEERPIPDDHDAGTRGR